MKKTTPLLACAVLAAGLVAQSASAQFITNTVQNSQGMGLRYDFATATAAQQGGTDPWKPSARNAAGTALNPTTGIANKIWLQFDLSSVWATYGQTNLASATITLWGENGNTRRFDVYGLNEGGNEAWTSAGLSWANAPGNVVNSGYQFSSSTLLYQRTNNTTDPAGVNLPTNSASPVYLGTAYDQCARYTSGDISSFLLTDADGKVTMMIGDGLVNDNQNWWAGVGGVYDVTSQQYFTADGQLLRNSPTLTLIFIPEPTTLSLAVLGLGGLLLARRRSSRN